MRRVMLLVVLAFVAAACRGGSTGTTPTPNPQNGSPPAGVTIWSFIYKPVSSHTCPGPPAIPNDGGTVTITLAPDGNTLSLVGVAQTTITVPTIAKDRQNAKLLRGHG